MMVRAALSLAVLFGGMFLLAQQLPVCDRARCSAIGAPAGDLGPRDATGGSNVRAGRTIAERPFALPRAGTETALRAGPIRAASSDVMPAEIRRGDTASRATILLASATKSAETRPAADEPKSDAADDLPPELIQLREKLRRTLDIYYERKLDTASRGPWAIMHGIIAFGVDTQLRRGGPDGPEVSGIGWLCFNGVSAGQRLLYTDSAGRLGVQNGPGVQGHEGQFLAILAQSRLKDDYPIRVDGKEFNIGDLIEYEKRTCRSGTELTFKLIGLMHYLKSDETWKNDLNETWSIQRLIREELAQPVRSAACGGTHRMMGFSYATRKRRERGEKMVGQFARAAKFVEDYHEYTFKLQNADGSFSTNWFNGRGDWADLNRRLQTTGHILEWLVYSLDKDALRDPRVVKAVDYLAGMLLDSPRRQWEVGPLGHGLHALVLYDERVLKSWKPQSASSSAKTDRG